MANDELEERLKAVERLTALYKPERTIHLIATGIALIMLFVCAGLMIYKREVGSAELTLLFGSSGLITLAAGQLLRMWDRALSVVMRDKQEQK
jgi:hypothetical protein